MKQLTDVERKIVKELIKDPRISDNQIAKNTGVPVMTVNRRRKQLENEEIIYYFTALRYGVGGVSDICSRQMYIIKLNIGITKKQFFDAVFGDKTIQKDLAKYISESYIGEKDGHLAIMAVADAKNEAELLENFNGKLIPGIKEKLGKDAVVDVQTLKLWMPIRLHHNYIPSRNMEKGKIKKDWPMIGYLWINQLHWKSNSLHELVAMPTKLYP